MPTMSLGADRDLALVRFAVTTAEPGVETLNRSQADAGHSSSGRSSLRQKNRLQLAVCLRYMEKKDNAKLRELVELAINVDNKSTSNDPLEISEVEALSRKVEQLRFADVAEMCVHVAKKVIGEGKTAEFFNSAH